MPKNLFISYGQKLELDWGILLNCGKMPHANERVVRRALRAKYQSSSWVLE